MYIIKQATVADAVHIHQLAHQIWPATYSSILSEEQLNFMLADRYSVEAIAAQIETDDQTYLLIIKDDKPVAFAAYSQDEDEPEAFHLHKLYLLPSTQRKGYGRALIQAVAERALAAGKNKLELNVQRQNPAKGFYEKVGFKVIRKVDIPYGDYMLTDYIMRKEL